MSAIKKHFELTVIGVDRDFCPILPHSCSVLLVHYHRSSTFLLLFNFSLLDPLNLIPPSNTSPATPSPYQTCKLPLLLEERIRRLLRQSLLRSIIQFSAKNIIVETIPKMWSFFLESFHIVSDACLIVRLRGFFLIEEIEKLRSSLRSIFHYWRPSETQPIPMSYMRQVLEIRVEAKYVLPYGSMLQGTLCGMKIW